MNLSRREDPLAAMVRRRHFVEIWWCGKRIEGPVVMNVAYGSDEDMLELVKAAAAVNEDDAVKAPFRYMVRLYGYHQGRTKPRVGGRVMDYVPREGEEEIRGYGYAA